MVQCAAFNCNVKSGQGVSMFLFPKDVRLRKIWTEKLKRKGFQPSDYSKICEKHFEKDQFLLNQDIAASIGYSPKQKSLLIPNAVPTIFDFTTGKKETPTMPNPNSNKTVKRPSQRKSLALEKRKRIEVLDELLCEAESFPQPNTSMDGEDSTIFEEDSQSLDETVTSFVSSDISLDRCSAEKGVVNEFTQTYVKTRSVEVQTDDVIIQSIRNPLSTPGSKKTEPAIHVEENLNQSFISVDELTETDDPDWEPDDMMQSSYESDDNLGPAEERKFLIYESNLDKLLETCRQCGEKCVLTKNVVGTFLSVTTLCRNCHDIYKWASQPSSGTMPFGNLIMAGAILFSGSSASKVLTMFRHASIQIFSLSTFMKIQSLYLVPSVRHVWESQQIDIFVDGRTKDEPFIVGGDGRCCSPGHTAKYSSYSLMDLRTSKIIDIQLVQSNEVKNSYAMELEGLKRCLQKVENEEVTISHLVTDRHSQIKKYMREGHPEIQHWFDVWHVAKGIFKKLESIGKKKTCQIVGSWARSISNHLYWCASSSGNDGELILEKWLSILNHVTNVHEGHGDRYPSCEHGPLEGRAWIKKGSIAYKELEKVIKGRLLMTDIKKLSPAQQTSGLEAFHKVVCHFAPKLVHYFHAQMEARLFLAALHFNENCCREQARNKLGEAIFAVSYPKARKGEGVAKQVKVEQTYEYVSELMSHLILTRESNKSFSKAKEAQGDHDRPSPLSKSTSHEGKADIVERHRTRFN